MSFRQSPWYLSGVFILIIIILILVYIIALKGVSFLITILSSSSIRLLIGYNNRNDLGLGIINGFDVCGPNINGFDIYNPSVYNLPG